MTHAKEDQRAPSAARPAQPDFTIVVWEDLRDNGNGYDIYMQKIDTQTGLPLWLEPDGVPVCMAPGDQRNPRAAYDSLGGVIIAWEDGRGSTRSVYAHRALVSSGALDGNWPADGLAVCDLDSDCAHVRIAGTADGAFITWLDFRDYSNGRNRAVYAQYLLSATASWPQSAGQFWVQDGIRVNAVIGNGDTEHPEIDRDYIWRRDADLSTKAGCVIAYQNLVEIAGQYYWNIWATNLDADGLQRYDLSLIDPGAEADQLYPRVVCAGKEVTADQARAIVVWQDAREDPTAPLYDIVAQVVDGDGNRQNPAGEIICDVPETQRYPVLTLWERPYNPLNGEPYVPFATFAWEDVREYAQTRVDIYAGMLDARFMMLTNPGGPAGDAIAQVASDQTQVAIDMVPGTTTAFIAWCHLNTNPDETDIHYQEVDVHPWPWQFGKPVGGWPVTAAKDHQQHLEVAGAVMVWEDNRRRTIHNDLREDWDLYCQTPGECVGPTAMNWRDMFAKVTATSDANTYRMATDDEHNTYIVWDEERDPSNGRQIWVQKFDKTGVPRWTNGGFRVSSINFPTLSAKLPDITPDYNGGAQITWQQVTTATGYVDVMYARVLYDGTCSANDVLRVRDAIDPGSSTPYIEPKIAWMPQTSWGPGAMIAFFDSTANSRSRWVIRAVLGTPCFLVTTVNGRHNLPPRTNSPYYFGLEIAAHGEGGIHMLTRAEDRSTNPPTFYLNMATVREQGGNLASQQLETKPFTDFGGYDIAVDPLSPLPHSALVAYSIKGPTTYFDIHVERYPGPWMNSGGEQSMPLTAGSTGTEAKQPAICPDLLDITGQGDGGMLVTWDYYFINASHLPRHKVQTTQVSFTGFPSWIVPPFDVSTELAAPSWPDIARLDTPGTDSDATGMLVWEGGGETSSCSPPRPTEIYSQIARYGNIGGVQGTLWNAEEMVSPGPGNYMQLRPTIHRSDDETCTVFWFDGRAGTKNPMGTRVEDLGGQGIGWLKPATRPVRTSRQVPTGFDVVMYPNPFDRSVASQARVVIDNDIEEYTSVRVFDLLGRTVATLHEGTLRKGSATLYFDATTRLATGTWLLGITSATRRTVLPFVVMN